jgi:hypothetical protein
LVLEGFSINSFNTFNITVLTLTGSFVGLSGVYVTPSPSIPGGLTPLVTIPVWEDLTNLKAP